MSTLRMLIVDDEADDYGWPKTFSKNIRTVMLSDLVGDRYTELEIAQVTNQLEADKAIAESQPLGYDLILLDLRYPLTSAGLDDNEEISTAEFQGMKWLPDLRRLQPHAAIIIVTGYAENEDLHNAVKAIRDHHANDFIPKTASFDNIVGRIRIAWENAQQANRLARFEEEFNYLVRTKSIRAYAAFRTIAEDFGKSLNITRTSLSKVAERLETNDPSMVKPSAESIRGQLKGLRKDFDELTRHLSEVEDPRIEIDMPAFIRQMLVLYGRMLEGASARVIKPDDDQHAAVETYANDLKAVLHELITNAIEALKKSATSPNDRRLEIAVEKEGGNVVVRVSDNGDGFSPEALNHLFERGFSTNKDDRHQGLGLYIARRLMHHIGGEIGAANRKEGGAEVTLTFRNLRKS